MNILIDEWIIWLLWSLCIAKITTGLIIFILKHKIKKLEKQIYEFKKGNN